MVMMAVVNRLFGGAGGCVMPMLVGPGCCIAKL